MKDLPENKTYYTRACKMARVITGHPTLRCSSCPWDDCILANPQLRREIFVAYVTNLLKIFGYTKELTIGTIIKELEED